MDCRPSCLAAASSSPWSRWDCSRRRLRDRMAGIVLRIRVSVAAGGVLAALLLGVWPKSSPTPGQESRFPRHRDRVAAAGAGARRRAAAHRRRHLQATRAGVRRRQQCRAASARLRRRADQRGFKVHRVRAGAQMKSVVVPEDRVVRLDGSRWSTYASEARASTRSSWPWTTGAAISAQGTARLPAGRHRGLELVTFLERETGKVHLDVLTPSWMIFGAGFPPRRHAPTSERAFDLLASFALLLLASADHAAHHAGHQARGRLLGAGASTASSVSASTGRIFRVLKFRSMRVDAETDGAQLGQRPTTIASRASGSYHAQAAHRRAAAALQRAARRHEFRRPAAGAARVRRRSWPRPFLTTMSVTREARHHRLGAALLSLRRLRAGRHREAAVRPLLREEPRAWCSTS